MRVNAEKASETVRVNKAKFVFVTREIEEVIASVVDKVFFVETSLFAF